MFIVRYRYSLHVIVRFFRCSLIGNMLKSKMAQISTPVIDVPFLIDFGTQMMTGTRILFSRRERTTDKPHLFQIRAGSREANFLRPKNQESQNLSFALLSLFFYYDVKFHL